MTRAGFISVSLDAAEKQESGGSFLSEVRPAHHITATCRDVIASCHHPLHCISSQCKGLHAVRVHRPSAYLHPTAVFCWRASSAGACKWVHSAALYMVAAFHLFDWCVLFHGVKTAIILMCVHACMCWKEVHVPQRAEITIALSVYVYTTPHFSFLWCATCTLC